MAEEPAPHRDLVERLIAGFRENWTTLRDPQTLEAVIRREYLDPFWEALGWDVANAAHRSSAEKDVVIEAPVTTIEAERTRNRRPDYLFRIGGFPRFVVEAKKPAVDVLTDRDAIFQAKTYAWSAQIPFAVLTDFGHFRLFDATLKPYHGEPARGLVADFDLRFEDYLAQWDALHAMFGREAVEGGSLERLLAKLKHVRSGRRVRGIDHMLFDLRGTEPVDQVFLAHLEDYRLRFARALFDENPGEFPDSDTRHGAARLTEATQRLIDRLVFLRVCEDRDVTAWGGLRDAVNESISQRLDVSAELAARFREFDAQYNGYLFKAHYSEQLKVPAQLLADFVGSLYPPTAPYRFDAIGDDLLGIIYERFLGGVISVQRGQVKAEEKPEVRHAGGVYYTPRFVVDAIIRRVIGPQIEGKPPREVLDVKVLDPACGSGSFLIASYQYLIDHCERYVAENPRAATMPGGKGRGGDRKIAARGADGTWRLTPEFKGQLLTSCMHGVDIDAQAVEVTIMSLYLKLLEGGLPSDWQRELTFGRLLPPLDNNICCGNSLLSQTDFDDWWDERNGALFTEDADVRFRMNPFDWNSQTRGFGRLLDDHQGFDCIVGNPPYIRVQELNKWAPDECEFYKWRYDSAAKGNYDIYVAFLERGLELLAPGGLLGFICPHKFWQAAYGAGIRKIIAEGQHLRSIIDFSDQQVFRGATTYTAIHVLGKDKQRKTIDYARIDDLRDGEDQCERLESRARVDGAVRFRAARPVGDEPWVFVAEAQERWLTQVRDDWPRLGQLTYKIAQGIVTSADAVYFLNASGRKLRSDATNRDHVIETALVYPLLKGSIHMKRWLNSPTNRRVLFPYEKHQGGWRLIPADKLKSQYPRAWEYLIENEDRLRNRESGKMRDRDDWYGYIYPKNLEVMAMPKILVPAIGTRAEYCLDLHGKLCFVGSGGGGGGGYAILPSIKIDLAFLCGLLNSRVLDSYLKSVTTRFHSGWFAYSKLYLSQLPIKLPESHSDKRAAEQISQRVLRIVAAKEKLQTATLGSQERTLLEREVEAHEQRIDELVCRLYGVDAIPDA
jgi:hypothetical protein